MKRYFDKQSLVDQMCCVYIEHRLAYIKKTFKWKKVSDKKQIQFFFYRWTCSFSGNEFQIKTRQLNQVTKKEEEDKFWINVSIVFVFFSNFIEHNMHCIFLLHNAASLIYLDALVLFPKMNHDLNQDFLLLSKKYWTSQDFNYIIHRSYKLWFISYES